MLRGCVGGGLGVQSSKRTMPKWIERLEGQVEERSPQVPGSGRSSGRPLCSIHSKHHGRGRRGLRAAPPSPKQMWPVPFREHPWGRREAGSRCKANGQLFLTPFSSASPPPKCFA